MLLDQQRQLITNYFDEPTRLLKIKAGLMGEEKRAALVGFRRKDL